MRGPPHVGLLPPGWLQLVVAWALVALVLAGLVAPAVEYVASCHSHARGR